MHSMYIYQDSRLLAPFGTGISPGTSIPPLKQTSNLVTVFVKTKSVPKSRLHCISVVTDVSTQGNYVIDNFFTWQFFTCFLMASSVPFFESMYYILAIPWYVLVIGLHSLALKPLDKDLHFLCNCNLLLLPGNLKDLTLSKQNEEKNSSSCLQSHCRNVSTTPITAMFTSQCCPAER